MRPALFRTSWLALLLVVLPLVGRGDAPPQVTLATPGSSSRDSGAIDRFTLRFSEAMIPLGNPHARAPALSTCPVGVSGHWADQQTYEFDFKAPLPGGIVCQINLRPGLVTQSKARVIGATSFIIDTGGPSLRAVLVQGESGADGGRSIDEDQVFVVSTNVAADPATVAAKAGCAVNGVGETAAVDVLGPEVVGQVLGGLGADNYRVTRFLKQTGFDGKLTDDTPARKAAFGRMLALRCRRPLPPEHTMALIWPGTITDLNGKAAGRDQRFEFKVRARFQARWSCNRSAGDGMCNPIGTSTLTFSSPVERATALAARLVFADDTSRTPRVSDDDKDAIEVKEVRFDGPFPPKTQATVTLPTGVHDLSGRPLSNAARFPLPVRFSAAPPLLKFAAPFGIIEASDPVLPVTVRSIEPELAGKITSLDGHASTVLNNDLQIAAWVRKLNDAEDSNYERVNEGKPTEHLVNHTRDTALLGPTARPVSLALPGQGHDFEVIGIPLGGKGFHVVEYASPQLGASLLARPVPRYVAAGALVTDMAVHFKWGRESSLAWVTTLATGKPVAGAAVRVSDSCTGLELATGTTDANGLVKVGALLPPPGSDGACNQNFPHALMISARIAGDMSFTLTNWDKGISPYDFEMPFGRDDTGEVIHTVFDRALVRVGEVIHFKHILRRKIGSGFDFAAGATGELVLRHQGSDTSFTLPLSINPQGWGEGSWKVPQGAPLGDYALEFNVDGRSFGTEQTFRVDEYELPTMRASIALATPGHESVIQPSNLPLSLFVGYLSGGGAGKLPVTLRTDFTPWNETPRGWDGYEFGGEPVVEGTRALGGSGESEAEALPFAQVLPATLGADGTARAEVAVGAKVNRPLSLAVEMDYPDANGETLTASRRIQLFPAAVQIGVRTDGWLIRADDLRLKTVVLDLDGHPVANSQVSIALYSRAIITARRRLIGGFYAYDNQEKITRINANCTMTTDAGGRAGCKMAPGVSGEVTVVATVKDSAGRETRAVTTVWLAGRDDWWFGGDNGDRMDVVPEHPEYASGETARFQVRMPFREATALVTVEREGILSSFVTTLSGTDPVVEVPMPAAYAPNVFVSVMAIRGRVTGWREWLAELAEKVGQFFNLEPVTATVDLAKPAYRLGMTQVRVGWTGHQLQVAVTPERERFGVRQTAQVGLSVRTPDGAPARDADVAFVAVDEALLQLMPNPSWKVLDAMMGERNLEVTTSTAQMQVVGKRHYGKKAVAAGGGGGDASGINRENFQPVLLWRGHVPLDANGTAHVSVPLSDALSRFRLVAVATSGAGLFGTGEATIHTAQDLSIFPGLPDLVRTGDHYDAVFTLKNGTDHAMTVTATPTLSAGVAQVGPLSLSLAAGTAGTVRWGLDAPAQPGTITWTVEAHGDGGASDRVTVSQTVAPAVPTTVWAATLLRTGSPPLALATPPGALPGSYASVDLTDSLAAPLSGVRDYMRDYPWNCFEQRLSRIVVNGDTRGWQALALALPTYLDDDGLVRYWPSGEMHGSTELTAYVLAITTAAGLPLPEPERGRIIAALRRVASGRLTRDRFFHVDERLVRIAALSALARAGAADPALVAIIDMVPADMPTSTLAQWMIALDHMPKAPRALPLHAAAEVELRRRLVWSGTRLDLSDGPRAPWWMMVEPDEMAALALDAVLGNGGWINDQPRMMVGLAARQVHGHWDTTPANAWGTVVSHRFASLFSPQPVTGTTTLGLGSNRVEVKWPRPAAKDVPQLPLTTPGPLTMAHAGTGAPWAFVSVHAAVPITQPVFNGYRLSREVTVISAREPGKLSQGDVIRVRLTVQATAARTWVVLADPLPPGATVLSGLGGQSTILRNDEGAKTEGIWPSWTESPRDAWRAYYEWLPQGTTSVEYTVRLNGAGQFRLPPARVEAMYAPAINAQVPIAPLTVGSR